MRRSNFALRLLPSLADELKRVTGFFTKKIKRANPDDMISILELAGTDEMEIECHDLIEPDLSTES
jgi:hypothetical protein